MKKQIIVWLMVVLTLLLLVSACGKADEPLEGPQVQGVVQDISEDGTSVLVDSKAEYVTGLIWVRTDVNTVFDDVSRTFEIGNEVAFIVIGGIMESYPMQGYADVVVKNERP